MPYDHPTSSGAVNWCWPFPRTGVGALPRWVTRPILWRVWSTALAPVTGQFLLVTRTPEPPGVDSPRRTPVTPCGCLGSPCPDSLDRPSQAPTLGSPRRFGGVSWNASGPTCSRALSTRCSIDFAGPLVTVRRQVYFASAATWADTHTSHRCGVSPGIPRTPIHTIRSAVRRSKQPFLPIPSSR